MSFIPIHEVLEVVVKEGGLEQWASYDEQQQGFKHRLQAWGDRVHIPSAQLSNFLPIALWGDSAEYVHGDSLRLLLFNLNRPFQAESPRAREAGAPLSFGGLSLPIGGWRLLELFGVG